MIVGWGKCWLYGLQVTGAMPRAAIEPGKGPEGLCLALSSLFCRHKYPKYYNCLGQRGSFPLCTKQRQSRGCRVVDFSTENDHYRLGIKISIQISRYTKVHNIYYCSR